MRKQAQDMRGAQDMREELSPAKCLPLLTWKMQTDNDPNLTGNNNNNNLLLIRRKYLYEYIQMRLTSYIKIIIK